MKKRHFMLFIATMVCIFSYGQADIYTKEGYPLMNRKHALYSCLKSLNKDRSDKTALAICECQVQKMDRRFSSKQVKKHSQQGIIDLAALVKEDSLANKDIRGCFTGSGRTMLLQAESFEAEFVSNCKEALRSTSDKKLDSVQLSNFCNCQLDLVKDKKLTDAALSTLNDPNSLLFYEMIYKCGNPFVETQDGERNWTASSAADIKGKVTDTIPVLSLNGMTYVKVKVGSLVKVWLLDTGASDLLINTEMEEVLKKENILSTGNYLGTGEYELANGTIDTCRRYKINSVRIGDFTVDNVFVSVSEKGKRIIVGKALLNKFRTWSLNHEENKLILSK